MATGKLPTNGDAMSSGNGDWTAPGSNAPPPGWSEQQPPPVPPSSWGPPPAGPPSPWGPAYAPPPPPQPGIIPLRPIGVGEILDGAFTAVRRYPRATLGLSAAVMLVVTTINVALEWYLLRNLAAPIGGTISDASGYQARINTYGAIASLITLLATLLLSGLLTAVIGEAVLGRPVTPAQAWQRLRPLIWRLIGVALLTFVISAVFIFVAVLPGIVVLVAGSDGLGIALLVLGFLIGGAYIFVTLSLSESALVLEKQTVVGALRRSRLLVKTSWWRIFGILLLGAIISSIVGAIIQVPFGLASGGLVTFSSHPSNFHFATLAINGVGSLLAATLVRPFSAGVTTLLYIDRRMRAEALDVALARTAAEAPPAA